MVTLTKQDCEKIDQGFSILKKNQDDTSAMKQISSVISKATNKKVTLNIVNLSDDLTTQSFIMSICPNDSSVNRIIEAIVNNDTSKLISDTWEGCKEWTIEIDRRVLTHSIDFTPRELTALIMHEIQHMLYATSTRRRIINTFKMCFVKQSIDVQKLLGSKMFSDFNSPIIKNLFNVILTVPNNARELRKELNADKFASKMGYTKELQSVIIKLLNYNENNEQMYVGWTKNNKFKETEELFAYTADTLQQLTKRNYALARRAYSDLSSTNESVQESFDRVMENILPDFESVSSSGNQHYKRVSDNINRILTDLYNSDYFLEGVFTKRLKRIDPYDLSYIDIQISSARTDEDRILINAFLHSKLDLVEYYLTLLDRNDTHYVVPHSKTELLKMRERLYNSEKALINKDTSLKPVSFMDVYKPQYPAGYEG